MTREFKVVREPYPCVHCREVSFHSYQITENDYNADVTQSTINELLVKA